MKKNSFKIIFLTIVLACMMNLTACAETAESHGNSDSNRGHSDQNAEPRDNTPLVLENTASEEVLYQNELATLDASHTSDGYVMVKYHGSNEKVKLQIIAPDETAYTYLVSDVDTYHVYPLPGGNGSYHVRVLESLSVSDTKYAIVFKQDLDVTIADEFSPFLRPNYYVNFENGSKTVAKAKDLATDCYCDLDVVENVYYHVIKNVTYDTDKAQNVAYGYTPDPDETLETGKGICFDYASLMSAMLRSQRIPTRLEVGYAGDVYHAWISCYVDEIGWVDNIISFDGENWSLMDPTLAANNSSSEVEQYIGDGSNYLIKYTY